MFVHGSVVNGRATWAAQRPLAERFELLVLDRPGFPPNPPVDSRRLRDGREARCRPAPARRPPRRALVRRRHLPARRGSPVRAARLAHRDRASGDDGRCREPGGGRVRRSGCGSLCVGRERRPRGLPAEVPARGRLAVRPALTAYRRILRRVRGRSRSSAVRGRPRSRSRSSRRRASRSSSCRGRTTRHSTRSATCWSSELPAERVVLAGYGHVAQLHPAFNEALADFVANGG